MATESATTTTTSASSVPSDQVIPDIMKEGLQTMVIQTGVGLVLGGMAGIVLSRGGGASSARKVLAGFGAGCGLGSAWTRTSMDLDDLATTSFTK